MLNEKARLAVELADTCVALEKRDEICSCLEYEPCEPCRQLKLALVDVRSRYEALPGEAGGMREKLPDRREGTYTQKVKCGGQTVYISANGFLDGRAAEFFVDISQDGTPVRGFLNAFAVACSLSLQYGCPLQELVDAFVGVKFEPAGIVMVQDDQGKVFQHPTIPDATSLVDLVLQDVGQAFGAKPPKGQLVKALDI
jgi:hypothetical protein